MLSRSFRCGLVCSTALLGVLLPSLAKAQETAIGLEEIVVTAERRQVDLQRSALAISAVSGENLTKQGVVDAFDLQKIVPALNVASGSAGSNVYINGVGGGVSNLYGSPTVAYNLDGVTLAQPVGASASFFDLERVEVLKGPQGTLYGRNATGGAINLLPKAPTFIHGGATEVQVGNYDLIDVSGHINLPLSDTVAVRASFSTVKRDGYLSNGLNDADRQAARLQLLAVPNDRVKVRLAVDYFQSGGKGEGEVPLYPGRGFNGRPAIVPGFQGKFLDPDNKWASFDSSYRQNRCLPPGACYIRASGATTTAAPVNDGLSATAPLVGDDVSRDQQQLVVRGQLEWHLGFADLTVIPALVRTKVDNVSYANFRESLTKQDTKQTSLETRLASNGDGPLTWVAGVYYFKQDLDGSNLFFQTNNGFTGLVTPTLIAEQWAVFGQATYALNDRLRLTAGLRYTTEEGKQDGYLISPTVFLLPAPIGNPQSRLPSRGETSFDATNFLVRGEWDWREDGMVYATYSTGFKAGGFNPGLAPNTFPPEEIKAAELGSRNRFFDRRLQANLTAFYWKYQNQQLPQNKVVQPCPQSCIAFQVVPVPKSHIWGVEADIRYLLTDNIRLGLNLIRQKGVFDQYATTPVPPPFNFPGVDYSGNERALTPNWAAVLSYEQTFPLANDGEVVVDVLSRIQSKQFLTNNLNPNVPLELQTQKAYSLIDASLAYRAPGGDWTASVWARNLTNEFILTATGSPSGSFAAQVMAPRTFGVRLSARFGGR